MAIGKEGNVKWVDGLRGLASFTVVITHLCRSFDENLFRPSDQEHGPIRILQWPYIRVFVQGRIGVAIFCMVTGYVCALKPVKLIREGNHEAALMSVSKSALRRIPRVGLPAAVATFFVWIVTQFGSFNVAKHSGCSWIVVTSPRQWPTVWETIRDLYVNIILTWTEGRNSYDPNQWTLMPLLKGGMLIYVYLLGTCKLAPKFRMMVALSMWFYYYLANHAWYLQFFWGAFLIDFQSHQPITEFFAARPRLTRVLCIFCMTFGMFVASAPEYNQDWSAWSNNLKVALDVVLPYNVDYPKYTTAIGLELISLGLYFSPWLRDMLSNQYFLWLGRHSFAVYLLHGPLLRTVLCWMVFGFSIPPDHKNDEGNMVGTAFPRPSPLRIVACMPIWFPMVYGLAVLWTTYIDSWCAKVTEKFVAYVKEEEGEKSLLPIRQD